MFTVNLQHIHPNFPLKSEHIIFGFHTKNVDSNLLIIFGKFYNHKCKFSSSSNFFLVLIKPIQIHLRLSLQASIRKPYVSMFCVKCMLYLCSLVIFEVYLVKLCYLLVVLLLLCATKLFKHKKKLFCSAEFLLNLWWPLASTPSWRSKLKALKLQLLHLYQIKSLIS